LEKKYTKEYFDIKYQYEMKCKELYEGISSIVIGDSTPTTDNFTPQDIETYKLVKIDKSEEVGIPEYWLRAMDNSKCFYNMNDKDREILKFLDDVVLEFEKNNVNRYNLNLGF